MPSLETLAILALVNAALVLIVVRGLKGALAWLPSEPDWHDDALRVAAVVVGGAGGLLGLGVTELHWPLLVAGGLGIGANATVVVGLVKTLLLPWTRG